jgi:hypothetical protein
MISPGTFSSSQLMSSGRRPAEPLSRPSRRVVSKVSWRASRASRGGSCARARSASRRRRLSARRAARSPRAAAGAVALLGQRGVERQVQRHRARYTGTSVAPSICAIRSAASRPRWESSVPRNGKRIRPSARGGDGGAATQARRAPRGAQRDHGDGEDDARRSSSTSVRSLGAVGDDAQVDARQGAQDLKQQRGLRQALPRRCARAGCPSGCRSCPARAATRVITSIITSPSSTSTCAPSTDASRRTAASSGSPPRASAAPA